VALAAAEHAHELLAAGTAIGEEQYAGWADPAREQMGELLRRVRLAAAEASLATGDPRRAAGYAEAAIAADPLDEAAHRWYISASVAAGEQARALAAYEALRQRLARELGADPTPQTRELHLAILREQHGGLATTGSRRAVAGEPEKRRSCWLGRAYYSFSTLLCVPNALPSPVATPSVRRPMRPSSGPSLAGPSAFFPLAGWALTSSPP